MLHHSALIQPIFFHLPFMKKMIISVCSLIMPLDYLSPTLSFVVQVVTESWGGDY